MPLRSFAAVKIAEGSYAVMDADTFQWIEAVSVDDGADVEQSVRDWMGILDREPVTIMTRDEWNQKRKNAGLV
jgi:hypothetical protein